MTVKKLKAFDCNDLMLSHGGPGALLFVLASDYDALEAEWMSLSQEDGKVERALVRAEKRIAELESALRGVMGIIGGECDCIYSDESNQAQCPCKQARTALETAVKP